MTTYRDAREGRGETLRKLDHRARLATKNSLLLWVTVISLINDEGEFLDRAAPRQDNEMLSVVALS